ncbi:hypothetical protein CASFOL_023838 [Castilleja foliolosa]|uniref:Protein kinase domain-containing protein n=1 Tax=Castilleja foliolosa TaxID=1961234 RepID=A0ABD3CMU9_9LAMI
MAKDKSRGKNKLIEDWLSNKIKNTEDLSTIVDPRMVGQLSEAMIHKALKISLACVKRSATDRPDMKEVVLAMNCLCPKPESLAEWPEIFDRVQQFSSLLRRVPEKYSAKKFHVFSRTEVYEMTLNFSDSGCIRDRDCDFGPVYRGKQPHTNLSFEMKRQLPLNPTASKQFHDEVNLLTKMSHRNVAEIIGKHDYNDEHIIVQPYMRSGSLCRWLSLGSVASLKWDVRMQIAVGVAKGLCYIHRDAGFPVSHNNIRSTNILIDAEGQPRISDFGRATCIKDAKDEFCWEYFITKNFLLPFMYLPFLGLLEFW